MESQKFKAQALQIYFNQDHSAENNALTESLEGLISDQYPNLLPKEFMATLKISPEQMDLVNDILPLSPIEFAQKYSLFDPTQHKSSETISLTDKIANAELAAERPVQPAAPTKSQNRSPEL